MEHNPFLKPGAPGARGAAEQRENIPWQHRAEPPSEFEDRLGDALEVIFDRGIEELPELVRQLNACGSRDRGGAPWTEDTFQAEMRRLGA